MQHARLHNEALTQHENLSQKTMCFPQATANLNVQDSTASHRSASCAHGSCKSASLTEERASKRPRARSAQRCLRGARTSSDKSGPSTLGLYIMCICVYMYTYTYSSMYIYVYIYIHIYECIYVQTYIYIYTCTYVYELCMSI